MLAVPQLPDPIFLMSLYNENIREGRVTMHPWQTEVLQRFSLPATRFNYVEDVNRINLVAANGSGKSAYVVAPSGVWTAMSQPESIVAITSSSGTQLDRQTGAAIKHVCEQVNRLHQKQLWTCKYRDYTFDPTGDGRHKSKIYLYATDEPGKAEGYHPLVPGGMFAYIADEAKSVTDEIFAAIERCNGKSHWMNVSSPGQPLGFFYNAYTSSRWWNRKVTAYECPHIKKSEIDSAREAFGEGSPLFRSAYLAEFTSVNESVVIPFERILAQYRHPADYVRDGIRRAGVDLSAGGDEQCVVVMDGNQMIAIEAACLTDHRLIHRWLVGIFRKYNLSGENINVDDGYTGRAVIDYLRNDNYHVVPVQFGGKAYNSVAYANRGTEMWLNYERHLQYLRLQDDAKLKKQLASRYYKRSDATGKIILESKREARANGHGSPDRGDAAVLALARCPVGYFAGGVAAAAAPTDEEQAQELLRRMAVDSHLQLTEEQIIKVTLAYRAIKDQRRQQKQTPASDAYDLSSMISGGNRCKYDCQDFATGNEQTNKENTFKFGRGEVTYGE